MQKAYCINPCATRCPGNSKRCAKRPPPSLSLYALTTTSAADSWSPVRNGPPLLLSASASGCSEPSNRLICAAEAPPPRPQERPEAPAAASSPEGGCAGVCHMTRVLCTHVCNGWRNKIHTAAISHDAPADTIAGAARSISLSTAAAAAGSDGLRLAGASGKVISSHLHRMLQCAWSAFSMQTRQQRQSFAPATHKHISTTLTH